MKTIEFKIFDLSAAAKTLQELIDSVQMQARERKLTVTAKMVDSFVCATQANTDAQIKWNGGVVTSASYGNKWDTTCLHLQRDGHAFIATAWRGRPSGAMFGKKSGVVYVDGKAVKK